VKRLVIIVSGSRRLHTREHHHAIREYIKSKLGDRRHVQVVVLHGAQKGADLIADEAARDLGLDSWGIPYFSELDEPSTKHFPGGPRRNECLVDVACVLRATKLYQVEMGAFPDAESRGTWHAIRYAKQNGIVAEVRKQ